MPFSDLSFCPSVSGYALQFHGLLLSSGNIPRMVPKTKTLRTTT